MKNATERTPERRDVDTLRRALEIINAIKSQSRLDILVVEAEEAHDAVTAMIRRAEAIIARREWEKETSA